MRRGAARRRCCGTSKSRPKKTPIAKPQRTGPEPSSRSRASTPRGERAVYETGIKGMHPELVRLVGRMKYRTSYGQNILDHSKEVAWLAGMMAAELKLDAHLAKRGGLLHDIGKVLTQEHDGTHVQLGVEVATKYGEHPVVINCIAAHHDDVPHEGPVSGIVQAPDAGPGARPGARREAFETDVKRRTELERIGCEFPGG